MAEMKPAAEKCAAQATDPAKLSGEWVDQNTLVSCLQRSFYSYSCLGEKRCLATIKDYYDKCYWLAYPSGTAPQDVQAGSKLGACLQERSALAEP